MINDVMKDAEGKMKKALEALRKELHTIRTGRASTSLVERVEVEMYGSMMPLNQLANITVPEPRLIVIQPYDKGSFGAIEKGIRAAELGLNPANDGKVIRVPIPSLTEERRKEFTKMVKQKVEESRVAIRNIRREHMDDLKDLEKEKTIAEDEHKRANEQLQHLTDKYVKETEEIGAAKEKDIMEV